MTVFRGVAAANGNAQQRPRAGNTDRILRPPRRREEGGFGQGRKPIVQIPESVRQKFSKGEMGGPEAFMDDRALALLSNGKKN